MDNYWLIDGLATAAYDLNVVFVVLAVAATIAALVGEMPKLAACFGGVLVLALLCFFPTSVLASYRDHLARQQTFQQQLVCACGEECALIEEEPIEDEPVMEDQP